MGKKVKSQDLYSRRSFMKWIGFLSIIPVIYVWVKLIKRDDFIKKEKELVFPLKDLSEGFNIFDKVIIVKSGNSLEVFSSSCTHLGCAINRIDKEELVCPCHGSRYDKNGNPVKGPSVKALKKLRFVVNDEGKEIVVNLVV